MAETRIAVRDALVGVQLGPLQQVAGDRGPESRHRVVEHARGPARSGYAAPDGLAGCRARSSPQPAGTAGSCEPDGACFRFVPGANGYKQCFSSAALSAGSWQGLPSAGGPMGLAERFHLSRLQTQVETLNINQVAAGRPSCSRYSMRRASSRIRRDSPLARKNGWPRSNATAPLTRPLCI